MRAAIFIDGGYFLKHVQDAASSVDYTKLAKYLLDPVQGVGSLDLMRCYFYYCPPYISLEPTEEEIRRMAVHEKFVAQLEAIDRWQFRKGKLEKRREGDRDVYSQKRVDVMLSVDMVRHAAAGHVQHALLVAGDSDFIPAVKAAKEEGVTITLWCAHDKSAHRDLVSLSDEVRYFDWSKIPRIQKVGAPPIGSQQQKKKSRGRRPQAGSASSEAKIEAKVEAKPAPTPNNRPAQPKPETRPAVNPAANPAPRPGPVVEQTGELDPQKKKTKRSRSRRKPAKT